VLLREVAAEAEKAGAWLAAARALNNLLSTPFPFSADDQRALLERMRTAAEKAGFDALAVAAYYQGRATLAMHRRRPAAAIAAIDDGRRRDQGTLRTSQGEDYHGAFRAGLALEAGDVELADSIARGCSSPRPPPAPRCGRGSPGWRSTSPPGAATGRQPAGCSRRCWRSSEGRKLWGDFVHDLVSAGLSAGLPPVELRRLTGYMSARRTDGAAWCRRNWPRPSTVRGSPCPTTSGP
jgi:hypothetical protein